VEGGRNVCSVGGLSEGAAVGCVVVMSISKVIFKCITTWQAIILGNFAILGLLYFSVHSSYIGGANDMITDLRTEAISSIIIAWGVLLESREFTSVPVTLEQFQLVS